MLLIVCSFTHDQPGGSQLSTKTEKPANKEGIIVIYIFHCSSFEKHSRHRFHSRSFQSNLAEASFY